MTIFKTLWGLLFRLFPCPTRRKPTRVGDPSRYSPVLVTCNFHTTVKRVTRVLEKAGYVLEGRTRRSAVKDGRVIDQLLYAFVVPS